MDIFSTAYLMFLIKFCHGTDANPVFKLSHACIRHTTNYKVYHIFIKLKKIDQHVNMWLMLFAIRKILFCSALTENSLRC